MTVYIAAKGTPFLLAVADKGSQTTYLSGYDPTGLARAPSTLDQRNVAG